MSKINFGRVILGGLVAGLVLNVVDHIVYGVVLAEELAAAARQLGREPVLPIQMIWFVILDLLYGIFLVYLYAAIRPRFGPGPRTAIIAGFLAWVGAVLLLFVWIGAVVLHAVGEMPMDLFPTRVVVAGAVTALIALPAAAIVGAWLYREEGAVPGG